MCNVISLNCIWCKSPLCIKSKIERTAFAIIATKYCFQSCFLDVAYVGNFCIVTSCILWYVFLTHDGHFFPIFWHLLRWYCLAATSVKCVNFMHIRANFWISHGTSGQEIVKSTLYRFSHPSKIFLGKCYYARSRLDPQPFFCRWPQTILAFMVTTKVNTRQSWLVLDVRKKIG